jgi:hypothetical protein
MAGCVDGVLGDGRGGLAVVGDEGCVDLVVGGWVSGVSCVCVCVCVCGD